MKSVTIILTCYNRKEKTIEFIRSIYDDQYELYYVVTNDGSTDGTGDALKKLQSEKYKIHVVQGSGGLYWCGGMRKAIDYINEKKIKTDYYVLANDDVFVNKNAIREMVAQSERSNGSIIAGAVCNNKGNITYGGIRYRGQGIKYDLVKITDEDLNCDSFNCNLVLLPRKIFDAIGNFDSHFTHAMGDFDYGLRIKRAGYSIKSTNKYVGICEKNTLMHTWQDTTLTRGERFRLKESKKGLPYKEWFYFLHKNFGLGTAIVRSITPYIKILIGR